MPACKALSLSTTGKLHHLLFTICLQLYFKIHPIFLFKDFEFVIHFLSLSGITDFSNFFFISIGSLILMYIYNKIAPI